MAIFSYDSLSYDDYLWQPLAMTAIAMIVLSYDDLYQLRPLAMTALAMMVLSYDNSQLWWPIAITVLASYDSTDGA